MKVFFSMLFIILINSCAINLRERDNLDIEKYKEELSGFYTLSSGDENDYPLSRYRIPSYGESFEVLFTENNDLVIRSTNQKFKAIKYFEGEFKKNGVYEYLEKDNKGIPLINRSVKYLRLRMWKTSESDKLKIEIKSKSSAQIFIFLANRTKKTLKGTYRETNDPNNK